MPRFDVIRSTAFERSSPTFSAGCSRASWKAVIIASTRSERRIFSYFSLAVST